ncbi:MAG TPA: hypothetical protein VK961_22315, partial [Chthoniobacter sp.]|nr:hypothetical protein [Chthoniobacter sp.]
LLAGHPDDSARDYRKSLAWSVADENDPVYRKMRDLDAKRRQEEKAAALQKLQDILNPSAR